MSDSETVVGNPPVDLAAARRLLAAQPFSVLLGARMLAKQATLFKDAEWRYIVSTNTMLLLRGKVLHLVIFTNYDGPQDLEWVRFTTQRWVDELMRLNRR